VELAIVILQGIEGTAARDRIAAHLLDKDRSYFFFQGVFYMISDSKSLFRQLRNLSELEKDLPVESKEHGTNSGGSTGLKPDLGLGTLVDDDPWAFKLLDFLRLALDGHHQEMQALLRTQNHNTKSINIFDILSEYLGELVLHLDLELPGEGMGHKRCRSYAYVLFSYISLTYLSHKNSLTNSTITYVLHISTYFTLPLTLLPHHSDTMSRALCFVYFVKL